jgi:hypothetical protein
MKKPLINKAHTWSEDDKNVIHRMAIKVSLEQFRATNDPICLAQIVRYLDFHGVDEAEETLSNYLTKTTRKTNKYPGKLWWKNICDRYRRLQQKEEWSKASHEALSNEIYNKYRGAAISATYHQFSEALRKQLKKT